MRSTCLLTALVALLFTPCGLSEVTAQAQVDADVRKILVDRIDTQRQGVGLVVGIVDGGGRRVVTYGTTGASSGPALDGDTLFEIGSATKVFTAVLLADAAERGELALTDPVSKFLPADVRVPQRAGKHITLIDLATHTSGLPRLPGNLTPKDFSNPYADYTVAQLYEFLSAYELPRDIGSLYQYSNLGAGLLGHVLARKAGTDYETLVRRRITEPLGMRSTVVTLTDTLKPRLAVGHNAQRIAVRNWDIPTLAGAGALRSTANDMLTFLSAQIGLTASPLTKSMVASTTLRRPTPNPQMQIALGWHILTAPSGGEIVWHNGGTGGYRFFMGFNPKERRGVVVLSNMSTPAGADDIGRHLLEPSFPLMK